MNRQDFQISTSFDEALARHRSRGTIAMMADIEIAWLLLSLLADTRTYHGVRFASNFENVEEELGYAKGLLAALPEEERKEVEARFDHIYAAVAAIRRKAQRSIPDPENYEWSIQ